VWGRVRRPGVDPDAQPHELIESFLAINKLGTIAVPVNFRMTPPEIAFLVSDCQAEVVITESVLTCSPNPVQSPIRWTSPTTARR
jgi:acyl-CoA synthetase (AMP-forming)/AMP-acid ligase II